MQKNKSINLELLLHLSLWILLFSVYILIYQDSLPLAAYFKRATSNVLLMATLFYANAKILRKYLLDSKQPLLFFLCAISVFFLVAIMRGVINLSYSQVEQGLINTDNPVGVYLGTFMTSLGMVALSTFYYLLKDRYIEDRRKIVIMSERNEAELKFLKSQINPHFLFNTLNNIYSLAVVRSEKTADMVLQLSDLLRYVIYDTQVEKVPLEREVTFIKKFIALYQMRSKQALNIDVQIVGEIQNIQIEPLLLQPLVENCFKHGDFETNQAAFALFQLTIKENNLDFYAKNSTNPENQQKDKTSGVGLENIQRQLVLKYPNRHQWVINAEKYAFSVNLQIQLKHDNYKNFISR